MCDFSLQHIASRPAKVGDKLVTTDFGTGTNGFAPADTLPSETKVAVCVMPGTELAFEDGITTRPFSFFLGFGGDNKRAVKVARFTQVDKHITHAHHDALELPDGEVIRLTRLVEGQTATVLQLPAEPKNEAEAEAQKHAEFAG
jgi:hypothetical protein